MKKKQVEVIADTLRQNAARLVTNVWAARRAYIEPLCLDVPFSGSTTPSLYEGEADAKSADRLKPSFWSDTRDRLRRPPILGGNQNDIHERRSCAERPARLGRA
jgi:hypothetical protein